MLTILILTGVIIAIVKLSSSRDKLNTISGKMQQILESVQIIDTTVKYDTFDSRLSFLIKTVSSLPADYDKEAVSKKVLASFQKLYPDKEISPLMNQVLSHPKHILNIDFQDEAYAAFFCRFCELMSSEVLSLKTKPAKMRRIQSANEIFMEISNKLGSSQKPHLIRLMHEKQEELFKSVQS